MNNIRRVKPDLAGIRAAARVTIEGGLIVYPTDTTYAIGANAESNDAVQAVRRLKGRSATNAMSVIISTVEEIGTYATASDVQMRWARALLPGAVTILLRSNPNRQLACSESLVGIRIPDLDFCQRLAAEAGLPITTTSANLSGKDENYDVEDALLSLADRVADVHLVVDGGRLTRGKPSTVLDLTQPVPQIVRDGAVAPETIRHLIAQSGIQEPTAVGPRRVPTKEEIRDNG